MPLFKQSESTGYHWAIWKVEESQEQLLSLLPQNGDMFANKLNSFTSESRKKEWLAVRVLFYKMMGAVKGIAYLPSGKPYLPDGSGFISISHTRGYVAVIFSESQQVGIDIEQMGERALKLAPRFISPSEMPDATADKTSLIQLSNLVWSAKEVLFKCMDAENVDFREHLHVDLPDLSLTQGSFNARETHSPDNHTYTISFIVQPDEFVMTWTAFNHD